MRSGATGRPQIERRFVDLDLVKKIRATLKSGGSVSIPLGGDETHNVRARYYQHIKQLYGEMMRSTKRDGALIVWVEKR